MRVGVIRGDMPGPVFLADLETVSQFNPPTEPVGQARYLSRPDPTLVGNAMSANVSAGFASTGNMTFPLTLAAGNHTLMAKTSASAGFSTIVLPNGVYATMAALLTACNAVLAPYGMALEQSPLSAVRVVLYSLTKGVGSYIEIDTTAHGSTANGATAFNFGAGGGSFTVPSVATYIGATLPVGGPLDVRATTIRTNLGPALTAAQVAAMADVIAPQFIETDVAIKCFQVGDLHDLRSASFNPDPSRVPPLSNGAAVTVVQDDGNTLFTAPLTVVTNAQLGVPGAGQVTITGTNLGNSEREESVVEFLDTLNLPGQHLPVQLPQKLIEHAGGSVGATSIVIPASLVPSWAVVTTTKVRVQYTSFISNAFALV